MPAPDQPVRGRGKKLRLAVAIARRPEAYRGGAQSPDGSAWEIDGRRYETNPRLLLSANELEMVRLWRLYQGGFGPGHLPDPGGSLDQAAIMIDAFAIMSAEDARLAKLRR